MRQVCKTRRLRRKSNWCPTRTVLVAGRFHVLYPLLLAFCCLALAAPLRADTISGTVKDPSGAVVAAARIEITGGDLSRPLQLISDESGKFVVPNLTSGKYSLRVAKEGFDDLVTSVDLHGTAELALSLTITEQQTSITVNEKSSAFANSDGVYVQLRNEGLGDTFRCENVTLPIDVGTFELKSGTITFLGT